MNMSLYGNISNDVRTFIEFDKIYENRFDMDYHATSDDIYIGRYVLVRYSMDPHFNKKHYYTASAWKNVNDDNPDGRYYIVSSLGVPLKRDDVNKLYRGIARVKNPIETTDRFFKATDGEDGIGVIFKEIFASDVAGLNENLVNAYTAYLSGINTIMEKYKNLPIKEGTNEIADWNFADEIAKRDIQLTDVRNKYTQALAEYGNQTLAENDIDEYSYIKNYRIDEQIYGAAYDSTIWRKVYTNGTEKYTFVASLNSEVPTFQVTADAPSASPIAPHFGTESTESEYNLHVQVPWGFQVAPAGTELPSDEKAQRTDVAEDTLTGVYAYTYPEYDAAIYYNKAGFDPSKSVHSKDVAKVKVEDGKSVNSIKIEAIASGKEYGHNGEKDTQSLSIMLPALGDAVADVYDALYGKDRAEYNNGNTVTWKDSHSDADIINEVLPNGYNLGSLLGTIRSAHNLMGKIVDVPTDAEKTQTLDTIRDDLSYDLKNPDFYHDDTDAEDHIYKIGNDYYFKVKDYDYYKVGEYVEVSGDEKKNLHNYYGQYFMDQGSSKYYIKNAEGQYEKSKTVYNATTTYYTKYNGVYSPVNKKDFNDFEIEYNSNYYANAMSSRYYELNEDGKTYSASRDAVYNANKTYYIKIGEGYGYLPIAEDNTEFKEVYEPNYYYYYDDEKQEYVLDTGSYKENRKYFRRVFTSGYTPVALSEFERNTFFLRYEGGNRYESDLQPQVGVTYYSENDAYTLSNINLENTFYDKLYFYKTDVEVETNDQEKKVVANEDYAYNLNGSDYVTEIKNNYVLYNYDVDKTQLGREYYWLNQTNYEKDKYYIKNANNYVLSNNEYDKNQTYYKKDIIGGKETYQEINLSGENNGTLVDLKPLEQTLYHTPAEGTETVFLEISGGDYSSPSEMWQDISDGTSPLGHLSIVSSKTAQAYANADEFKKYYLYELPKFKPYKIVTINEKEYNATCRPINDIKTSLKYYIYKADGTYEKATGNFITNQVYWEKRSFAKEIDYFYEQTPELNPETNEIILRRSYSFDIEEFFVTDKNVSWEKTYNKYNDDGTENEYYNKYARDMTFLTVNAADKGNFYYRLVDTANNRIIYKQIKSQPEWDELYTLYKKSYELDKNDEGYENRFKLYRMKAPLKTFTVGSKPFYTANHYWLKELLRADKKTAAANNDETDITRYTLQTAAILPKKTADLAVGKSYCFIVMTDRNNVFYEKGKYYYKQDVDFNISEDAKRLGMELISGDRAKEITIYDSLFQRKAADGKTYYEYIYNLDTGYQDIIDSITISNETPNPNKVSYVVSKNLKTVTFKTEVLQNVKANINYYTPSYVMIKDYNELATPGRQYYMRSDYYIIENKNDENFELYSEWNVNNSFVPGSIEIGARVQSYILRRLPGFSINVNTMMGLILKINRMLLPDDEKTRDTSTVQGCLNIMQDIIKQFDELQPNALLVTDNFGRITASYPEGDGWIQSKMSTNKTYNTLEFYHSDPHVDEATNKKVGGVHYYHEEPTAVGEKDPDGMIQQYEITIPSISYDEKGHITASGTTDEEIPIATLTETLAFLNDDYVIFDKINIPDGTKITSISIKYI